jgi:hypothetical protein
MGLGDFAHTRFLDIQRVYRFTRSDNFISAEKKADNDQYKLLRKYIEISDIKRLRRIVKTIVQDELSLKPVTELRKLASKYRIPNYNLLLKEQLVEEIEEKEKDARPNT